MKEEQYKLFLQECREVRSEGRCQWQVHLQAKSVMLPGEEIEPFDRAQSCRNSDVSSLAREASRGIRTMDSGGNCF